MGNNWAGRNDSFPRTLNIGAEHDVGVVTSALEKLTKNS